MSYTKNKLFHNYIHYFKKEAQRKKRYKKRYKFYTYARKYIRNNFLVKVKLKPFIENYPVNGLFYDRFLKKHKNLVYNAAQIINLHQINKYYFKFLKKSKKKIIKRRKYRRNR